MTIKPPSKAHLALMGGMEADQGRFCAKVEVKGADECWNWLSQKDRKRYGIFTFRHNKQTVSVRATRVSYLWKYGRIDPQLFVCHSCDNPSCCNPLHLWLGTRQENAQDSLLKGRHFLRSRTHCIRGHLLSGPNLKTMPDGSRRCRECRKIHKANGKAKRSAMNQHSTQGTK